MMKKIFLKALIVFISVIPSTRLFSQSAKQKNNEIKFGGGVADSRKFTGIALTAAYNRFFGKNFVSFQYNYSEEFLVFGTANGKAREIALLVNRELLSRFVKISLGAGVSSVKHTIATYPRDVSLNQFGIPIELNITLGQGWFKTGFSAHYNANNYNPYCNFNWVYQFRLF